MIRIMTDFLLKEIESRMQWSKNLKYWKENKTKQNKTLRSIEFQLFNENIFSKIKVK